MSIQKKERNSAGKDLARLSLTAALAFVGIASATAAHAATVVKDPVTGELRAPTAEEFSTLEKQQIKDKATQKKLPGGKAAPVSAKSADAVDPETRLPNGAVGYRVGEEHMLYSVVTRNTDGTTTIQCVTGANAAEKLLKAPQSSAAKTDKEHGHAHR